jgi:hypothetical protein
VRTALRSIPAITAIRRVGPDPLMQGSTVWALDTAPGTHPAPDVLAAAHQLGWRIGALAPEHRTLDGVFKQLQLDHVAKQGVAA